MRIDNLVNADRVIYDLLCDPCTLGALNLRPSDCNTLFYIANEGFAKQDEISKFYRYINGTVKESTEVLTNLGLIRQVIDKGERLFYLSRDGLKLIGELNDKLEGI